MATRLREFRGQGYTGVSIATVYLLSDVTLLLRNLTFAVATHVGNQSLPFCSALAHSALMGGVFSHHHVVNKRKRCEKIRRLLGFASSLEREMRAIDSKHALRDDSQPFTCNFVSQYDYDWKYWKNKRRGAALCGACGVKHIYKPGTLG